jgi:hypothetical protein
LSQYVGKKQHGYWSLHVNGTLRRYKNCKGMNPKVFFRSNTIVTWWHVTCELDWYRMCKESSILKEGPIPEETA